MSCCNPNEEQAGRWMSATVHPVLVLVVKAIINESVAVEGKGLLREIVSMLIGLIRSNPPSREG